MLHIPRLESLAVITYLEDILINTLILINLIIISTVDCQTLCEALMFMFTGETL